MVAIREIDVALFDPSASRLDQLGRVELCIGGGRGGDGAGSESLGECSLIVVEVAAGAPVAATLTRSLTSSFDIHYAVADGRMIVSDRLDHVRASLPPELRGPDDAALIDHLLYRAPTGERSYCAAIRRVRHGARVSVTFRDGVVRVEQMRTVDRGATEESGAQTRVEAALAAALAQGDGRRALLFSGGTDSTLIATFLPDAPLVHAAVTCPEFAIETRTARAAAGRLRRPLAEAAPLEEAALLNALEATTARIGTPSHHAMTVLVDRALAHAGGDAVTGADADALFGLVNPYDVLLGVPARRPTMRRALTVAGRIVPGRVGAALRRGATAGPAFGRTLQDQAGYALAIKTAANASWASRAFGEAAVAERIAARWELMCALAPSLDPDSREPVDHLEARQLFAYFCNGTMATWRALATARGLRLSSPFNDERVFEAAMSAPPAQRYIKGRMVKPILKRLAVARAPGHPAGERKLGGALPIARLARGGALAELFERHPPPPPFRGIEMALAAESRPEPFWHVATYAVWLSDPQATLAAPHVCRFRASAGAAPEG